MEKQIGIEYPDGCGFPEGKICMKCALKWEKSHSGKYDVDSGRSTSGIFEGEIFSCTLCGENSEKESAIIIRNVPESIRKALKMKALAEDKTMQGLILELITRYVGEKQGE